MEANFWHSLLGGSTKNCDKTLFGEKIEQSFVETNVSSLQEILGQLLDVSKICFGEETYMLKAQNDEGREIFSACSVNYLLEGGPRVWYSIRKSDNGKLGSLYKQEMHSEENEQEEVDTMSCVLDDLIQSGVELFRAVQYKGEIVVTFPSANYVWISLGWMVGESLTFTVSKWLPTIREGVTTMCSLCKPCPVPYEEILKMEAVSVGEALKKMRHISREGAIVVIEEYHTYIEQLRHQQCKLQAKGCKRLKLDWPYGSNPCCKCKRSCFLSLVQLQGMSDPFCLDCPLKMTDSELDGGVVSIRRRQKLFEALASKLWRYHLTVD
eukprot:g7755.t1